jgi:hypothetical protein
MKHSNARPIQLDGQGPKATPSPNRLLDAVVAKGRRDPASPLHLWALDVLEHGLFEFQTVGQFRPGFDPHVVANAIRSTVDAAPLLLAVDSELDINHCAREIATVFDPATRAKDTS